MADLLEDPLLKELWRIRRELRIARVDLAATLGVNVNSVENWEVSLSDPGFRKVIRWAKALGYELDLHKIGDPE